MSEISDLESKLMLIQQTEPLDVLSWVETAKNIIPLYGLKDPSNNIYIHETSLTRENTLCIDFMLEHTSNLPVDILVVGLGGLINLGGFFNGVRNWSDAAAPFELYNILSQFEEKGVDYNLSVLDINEESLHKLKTADSLFVSSSYMNQHKDVIETWNRYLRRINSVEVCEMGREVLYKEVIERPGGVESETVEDSFIYSAPLPKRFLDKRSKNRINFVNADIVDTGLSTNSFDMIFCNNVIAYSEATIGKQLIMYELSRILKHGGLVEVNQRYDHFRFENKFGESIDFPLELQKGFSLRPIAFIFDNGYEQEYLKVASDFYASEKNNRPEPKWVIFQKN